MSVPRIVGSQEIKWVAPVDHEPPIQGEVVYCGKFGKARFFVELKFHSGPRHILRR